MSRNVDFRSIYVLILSFVGLLLAGTTAAQSRHQLLRKGDRAYDLEHYQESEQYYRDAADRQFGDPQALYNLGSAFYQQGKWEDATKRFSQAAEAATDPLFKADALHNLGNAHLKQQQFKEAVQAYEKSLRLRPGDAGTKQNLQMAKKKLREEQQRQQQQKQQQDQSQQNQDQSQQQENQQNQPQQQDQQQQSQPQQPQSGQQKQQEQEQPGEPQQPPKSAAKLKKEEAQRLLETAIGPEDRKNARKYREQRRQPSSSGKEKDW